MDVPWPVADLRARVALGAERAEGLLTDAERALVDAIASLDGAEAMLLARLAGRSTERWRLPDLLVAGVDDVPGAAAGLIARGWLDEDHDVAAQVARATRAVLQDACRRRGLPIDGARVALQARLLGHLGAAPAWDEAPWVRLAVGPTLRRFARWSSLRAWPDPSGEVLERMEVVRWPHYALTPGGARGVVSSRAVWDRWEAAMDDPDALDEAELFDLLASTDVPPAGLDVRGWLAQRVGELAVDAERVGDVDRAVALWARLAEVWPDAHGDAVLRRAGVLERAGRAHHAWEVLRAAHGSLDPVAKVAAARTGRRLARGLGVGWIPDPPLRAPPERDVTLHAVAEGGRLRWGAGAVADGRGRPVPVEVAVAGALAEVGRRAVHAEGALWRTMVSLLLTPALFAPVPGMLPVPRLDGPLDAGTAGFAERRPEIVAEIRAAVAAGEAPARIAAAWDLWAGCQVWGVTWEVADRDLLVALAAAAGPALLGVLLEARLAGGRGVFAGLPDLVLLDGPEARLPQAFPARVPAGLVWIEVKGPGDVVRDAQAVWFDRLIAAGARVEVWRVVPARAARPAPGGLSASGGSP
jgi:hypothetical protein